MSEYVITTDTMGDLPESYYAEHNIGVMSLTYLLEGVTYDKDNSLEEKEFYAKMRAGSMPTTSQVNPEKAAEEFEKHLAEGKDILHIAFSSGLSGSYNSALVAAKEMGEKYPDRKIIVVDSLCASLGQGLFTYKMVELKEQGKSMEEVATWGEENKLHVCHLFTVDDLFHLYRGGRVSKTTAILGTAVGIKPILHVDDEGHLTALSKVRGRKKSLITLVDNMEKQVGAYKNDIIMISHGDCLEDAEFVADQIKKRLGIKNVLINYVGPTIGTHSGPGTLALFFMGNKR